MTEQSNEVTDVVRDAAAQAGPDAGQASLPPADPVQPAVPQEPAPGEASASESVAAGPPQQDATAPEESAPVSAAAAPAKRTRTGKKAKPAEEIATQSTEPKSENMDWYILKVQSNREESIREGLLRRMAIAGLDRFVGDVIVPTEKVTEFKGGKKRVIKRKLYPGYLVVQMEINEDTWFLVRETPGIGDFTGASGRPTPMLPHEISRILAKQEEKSEKAPKLKIGVAAGERVKINEGTFENFEGEVESIDETNGRVTVMINIFGRSTPVELEYWQIEAV